MRSGPRKWVKKADRYLRSAELLLKDGDPHSAASRLYYAMFYCAEALLLEEGLSFSTHKGIISAFGERFVKTGRMAPETHQWLREAFDQRLVGDYDWEADLSTPDLQNLLIQARRFRDTIISYLDGQGPTSAQEPGAVYKTDKPRKKIQKKVKKLKRFT